MIKFQQPNRSGYIPMGLNDPLMNQLDAFLRSGDGLQRLAPVLKRILDKLEANRNLAQAWEALPPGFFGKPFPGGIESCWAFALRYRFHRTYGIVSR